MTHNTMIERLRNEFAEEIEYREEEYLTTEMRDAIEELLEEDFLYNINYEFQVTNIVDMKVSTIFNFIKKERLSYEKI